MIIPKKMSKKSTNNLYCPKSSLKQLKMAKKYLMIVIKYSVEWILGIFVVVLRVSNEHQLHN